MRGDDEEEPRGDRGDLHLLLGVSVTLLPPEEICRGDCMTPTLLGVDCVGLLCCEGELFRGLELLGDLALEILGDVKLDLRFLVADSDKM